MYLSKRCSFYCIARKAAYFLDINNISSNKHWLCLTKSRDSKSRQATPVTPTPRSARQGNRPCQESITRSKQLPCTRSTAFSLTSIFFEERFWREIRISFRSHKPVSKTKNPNSGIFDLLMTFIFPLSRYIFIMRS